MILVAVVFLLLFGGKKLPDAARGLGRSLRILKSEVGAMHEEQSEPVAAAPVAAASVPTAALSSGTSEPAPIPVTPLQANPNVGAHPAR
ncbi:MAG: Sec-independent protein translocase subunit TatA [Actinomycetota bacterium]|nr:Sec-independent protein translocase subunit TatA [Actinomycetota bacterium]